MKCAGENKITMELIDTLKSLLSIIGDEELLDAHAEYENNDDDEPTEHGPISCPICRAAAVIARIEGEWRQAM